MPSVSVIMPALNSEATIAEAVQSVQAQTMPDWELIVRDDGSRDGTADEVRRLAADDVRVRLIESGHDARGVAANRNAAIRLARGEWLAFLDADDLWLPTKLEAQLAHAASHADAVLVHSDYRILRDGKHYRRRYLPTWRGEVEGYIHDRMTWKNCIATSTVIARADAVRELGFDESLHAGTDYDLWIRLSSRGWIGYVSQPLAIYRDQSSTEFKRAASLARTEESLLHIARRYTGDGSRAREKALARVNGVMASRYLAAGAADEARARLMAGLRVNKLDPYGLLLVWLLAKSARGSAA